MDQANPQGSTVLQQGIAAARAKRKGEAYQLLRQVVTSDPRNSEAWLWLGAVAPTPQEQLQAFERVLALDPTNEKAQAGRRWASARVGAGAPASPPPAPASGISSQDMLGMFGGVPGATLSPSPAGGISSHDLLGTFGGVPASPARPDQPVAAPGSLGSSDLQGMLAPPPAAAPAPAPGAPSGAPPAPGPGAGLDLGTPQPFDPGMFGAVQAVPPPPTSALPPGAPGTPGGAEWRGYSDLQETEAFNWDDPGLGLSTAEPGTGTAPPPPGGAAPAGYAAAPSIFSDLDRDDQAAPAPAAAPAVELPLPQAAPRGTPTLVLLGAVVLIVLLLLIGILSALLSNKTVTLGTTTGPEDTVKGFLTAHVSANYTEASAFLVPALASEYRQIDSPLHTQLPDPRQVRGLSARVSPLADDGQRAEVYGFFASSATPAPDTLKTGPWLFTLEKRATGWVITTITPP